MVDSQESWRPTFLIASLFLKFSIIAVVDSPRVPSVAPWWLWSSIALAWAIQLEQLADLGTAVAAIVFARRMAFLLALAVIAFISRSNCSFC